MLKQAESAPGAWKARGGMGEAPQAATVEFASRVSALNIPGPSRQNGSTGAYLELSFRRDGKRRIALVVLKTLIL
jgi:hypothetical protein